MPELKLSLQLYLVNPPKNRVFLASLPTSLPSQAELFFLLFSLWTSRAAGFQLVQGQAGMSSACFYVPGMQSLCVTVDTFALLFLKARKGAAGEKG